MKLVFIKIGKAFSTLKREGIFWGGKRVARAIGGILIHSLKPKKGDILFISGGVGDSALYRTEHVAEELRFNGFVCATTVQDDPFLSTYVNKFKIFIFHRVLYTSAVAKLIKKIKRKGKEIIFETDDLVFDPRYLKYMDYYKKMNALERKLYENGVGGEILRDPYVKVCTTTTSFLAEKLKEENKKVFLVPNKLSKNDYKITENILKNPQFFQREEKEIRIGYFSGTISHNKDFATILKPLEKILETYPQVKLYLAGHLDVENVFVKKYLSQIKQLPFVSRRKHFENIAQVDINLAPLEMNNPFCEAKSELKFFEAGILKVPTVAVANQTFREAIDDGTDGFLAKNAEEWYEKIARLIENDKLRKEIGEKAREKVLRRYLTYRGKNEEYYQYLKSCLK